MGLDVYLYETVDEEKATAFDKVLEEHDERSTKLHEEIFEGFERAPWGEEETEEHKAEEQERRAKYNEANKKLKIELGIDPDVGWFHNPFRPSVELPSEKYPDHMFKIGYLRSSYNSGGINNVLTERGLPTLYELFGYDEADPEKYDPEDHRFRPDWQAARDACAEAVAAFRKYVEDQGDYRVATINFNMFKAPDEISSKEAMEIFQKHFADKDSHSPYSSYSCSEGSFMIDAPIAVVAAIPSSKCDALGTPGVHLVYRFEDDGEDGLNWYIQALEICVEMCDYVLARPENDFYMSWSY